MSAAEFRLARPEEKQRVLDFVNANFDWRLPLVNRPEWFHFYYESGDGLQFAVAEENGEWLAAAGYIRANRSPSPDIWVSVWVARKGHNGVGLELMEALPRLTGARVVACNNIRPKTMAFYRFLGWEADRVGHFFRLADRAEYRLAVPGPNAGRLPASGDLTLEPVHSVTRLQGMGMPPSSHTPVKDIWYMTRRYFDFDHYRYDVWCATERGKLLAYLVTRTADVTLDGGSRVKVLRMVDFIGEDVLMERSLLVTSDMDITVDLELSSSNRTMIKNLERSKDDIRLRVNLSSINGVGTYPLEWDIFYPDSVNPSSVTVSYASAYSITVDVVELYTKSVPIRGERTGSPAEGYMVGEMTFLK